MRVAVIILLGCVCVPIRAGSVVQHRFSLWGAIKTKYEKEAVYLGWTNGFIYAKGQPGIDFAACLEEMSAPQAIAMIDKFYENHPEKWSAPLGEQLLAALTIKGGTCSEMYGLTPEDWSEYLLESKKSTKK